MHDGQQLRGGLHDLGGDRGVGARGLGSGEGPGVEEGDPAAQHGAVVAVPGLQPPAGAGGVAVQLQEPGEAGTVPVGAHPVRGEPQVGGGPLDGRGTQATGRAGPQRGAAGALGGRPAGQPDGAGQSSSRLVGQLRPARDAVSYTHL